MLIDVYTVQEAGRRAGRKVVVVQEEGRYVGGASLNFVHWMHTHVPSHQLRPEQVALVKWYAERPPGLEGELELSFG